MKDLTKRMEKMNDYYFKVEDEGRTYYCEFTAPTYKRALRNLMFACFSYKHEDSKFKRDNPTADDKFSVYLDLYSDNVTESTYEVYKEKDEFQHD